MRSTTIHRFESGWTIMTSLWRHCNDGSNMVNYPQMAALFSFFPLSEFNLARLQNKWVHWVQNSFSKHSQASTEKEGVHRCPGLMAEQHAAAVSWIFPLALYVFLRERPTENTQIWWLTIFTIDRQTGGVSGIYRIAMDSHTMDRPFLDIAIYHTSQPSHRRWSRVVSLNGIHDLKLNDDPSSSKHFIKNNAILW